MRLEEKACSKDTAFFFIDETKDIKTYTEKGEEISCLMLGLLCVRGDQLLKLEEEFLKSRIKERMWGEVHYASLTGKTNTNYIDKYINVLSQYLSNSYVTFHSRMYAKPAKTERKKIHNGLEDDGEIFRRESYLLIRSVIMKCLISDFKDFYIVADSYSKGDEDYRIIRERLNEDPEIPELKSGNNLCCTTGNSCSCGGLQICDLLVSSLANYKYNKNGISKDKEKIIDTIKTMNNHLDPMEVEFFAPFLYSRKFQHSTLDEYKGISGIRINQ